MNEQTAGCRANGSEDLLSVECPAISPLKPKFDKTNKPQWVDDEAPDEVPAPASETPATTGNAVQQPDTDIIVLDADEATDQHTNTPRNTRTTLRDNPKIIRTSFGIIERAAVEEEGLVRKRRKREVVPEKEKVEEKGKNDKGKEKVSQEIQSLVSELAPRLIVESDLDSMPSPPVLIFKRIDFGKPPARKVLSLKASRKHPSPQNASEGKSGKKETSVLKAEEPKRQPVKEEAGLNDEIDPLLSEEEVGNQGKEEARCPLCDGLFPSDQIESHVQEEIRRSEQSTEGQGDEEAGPSTQLQKVSSEKAPMQEGKTECPICREQFSQESIDAHVNTHFQDEGNVQSGEEKKGKVEAKSERVSDVSSQGEEKRVVVVDITEEDEGAEKAKAQEPARKTKCRRTKKKDGEKEKKKEKKEKAKDEEKEKSTENQQEERMAKKRKGGKEEPPKAARKIRRILMGEDEEEEEEQAKAREANTAKEITKKDEEDSDTEKDDDDSLFKRTEPRDPSGIVSFFGNERLSLQKCPHCSRFLASDELAKHVASAHKAEEPRENTTTTPTKSSATTKSPSKQATTTTTTTTTTATTTTPTQPPPASPKRFAKRRRLSDQGTQTEGEKKDGHRNLSLGPPEDTLRGTKEEGKAKEQQNQGKAVAKPGETKVIDLADDSQEESPPTKKATGGSEGKGHPSIQTKSLSTKEFFNLFDTKQSKPDPPKKRRRTATEKKKPDKAEKKQTTTKAELDDEIEDFPDEDEWVRRFQHPQDEEGEEEEKEKEQGEEDEGGEGGASGAPEFDGFTFNFIPVDKATGGIDYLNQFKKGGGAGKASGRGRGRGRGKKNEDEEEMEGGYRAYNNNNNYHGANGNRQGAKGGWGRGRGRGGGGWRGRSYPWRGGRGRGGRGRGRGGKEKVDWASKGRGRVLGGASSKVKTEY